IGPKQSCSNWAKSPITVKSGPGFLIDCVLQSMINEAFFVLAESDASVTEIGEGMTLGSNHPIGPPALADLIGLDVLLAVMQTIKDEFDRNTGPARCSKKWSPQVPSAGKPAVVSTGTDDAVRTALTTTHRN